MSVYYKIYWIVFVGLSKLIDENILSKKLGFVSESRKPFGPNCTALFMSGDFFFNFCKLFAKLLGKYFMEKYLKFVLKFNVQNHDYKSNSFTVVKIAHKCKKLNIAQKVIFWSFTIPQRPF